MDEQSQKNVKKTLLIESQYLPNIQYFARLIHHKKVLIEQYEHFVKASYRNRAYILMPDGPLRLSIHVLGGRRNRDAMKNVKICNAHHWQRIHWQGMRTAYRSSPYFEYFEDDLAPFYETPATNLFDFNQSLIAHIIEMLGADIEMSYTEKFQKVYGDDILDWRSAIFPNNKSRADELFKAPIYHQVFEDKIGFHPNMSVLDLLFAEGPNALSVLESAMSEAAS